MQAIREIEPVNTRLIQINRRLAIDNDKLAAEVQQLRAQVRYYQRRNSERYAREIKRARLLDENIGYVIAAALVVLAMFGGVYGAYALTVWILGVI